MCDPRTCHNMGSSNQIDFDALVGRNIKSESEKEGGVFGECISKQYIVAVFKIKILKSHLCKV